MRRPHTGQDLKVAGRVGQIQFVQANLRYPQSVANAVEGADAVINLVALLYEKGHQTFENLHVNGAKTIAEAAKAQGIKNIVHVSSIGADIESASNYALTKGLGENIIKTTIPTADIMRPSIIFGAEDEFFNRFAAMAALSPTLPLIGGGQTKYQPVYVMDVANAIAKALGETSTGTTYELGGPQIYTFKSLMTYLLSVINKKRFLLPIPWFAGKMLGTIGDMSTIIPFISPFLTRDQVTLLKSDNIVGEDMLGFDDLGLAPDTI